MEKVKLGQTGELVSQFCLGAMYFGTKQNEEESFALLDQFVEAGGNFVDTANIYARWVPNGIGGESETCVGQWIKARGNREHVFIATKVGFPYQDVPRSLKANLIEEECNKSLQRMGIETIDLYYAHNDDRSTPLEETLEAFHRLVQAGKVRYIGASNYLAWRLEEAWWASHQHGWPTYQCIQQRHTYIRKKHGTTFDPQVAVNDDLLDYCRNREITLLAYSPLLQGAYTRQDRQFDEKYLGADTENRIAALRSVAAEIGATLSQVVLAWMLGSDPLVLPLVAASTQEQMDENLGALDIVLTDEQMERLNTAGP
ncbi:MAG: aldo/keto reductase [Anaerolineae bacterium]|jgi:aryl-alcohol dehydrogenase-like predicted oxidoreductase